MFYRAAELRAESCREAAAHSEAVVATVTEELRMLREELESRAATGKRWWFQTCYVNEGLLTIQIVFCCGQAVFFKAWAAAPQWPT